ncbi:MAG: hypothetical protein U0892_16675 [Pirellulales bacterium]
MAIVCGIAYSRWLCWSSQGETMERVRLLGLVLFITAVLLALATGVWDTQHVNVEGFPRLESFSQRVESTGVAPGADSRGQSVRLDGSSRWFGSAGGGR